MSPAPIEPDFEEEYTPIDAVLPPETEETPPPPPMAPPVSPPPPAAISAPPPPPPASVPPLASKRSLKQTVLGMAPVQIPGVVEPPPETTEDTSFEVPDDADYEDLEAPSFEEAAVAAFEVGDGDMTNLGEMEGTPFPGAIAEESFNAFDLGDDGMDDEFEEDEISQFNEATAITDVSNLALSSVAMGDMDDELPADLLNEIEALPSVALEENLPETMPAVQPMETQPAGVRMSGPKRPRLSPMLLGGIIGGVLAAVVLVIFALVGESDDAGDDSVATAPEKTPGETPDQKADDKKSLQEMLGGATPELAKEQKSGPDHKCKPISAYPDFPWFDKIKKAAASAKTDSICGLFGMSQESIAGGLTSEPHYGPTGYDLIPKGTLYEVFPLGEAKRRAPTMEFLFSDGRLFEIHLKYKMEAAKKIKRDIFKSLLGKPVMDKKDTLDREVARYQDGDLAIIHYKKVDAYDREFNDIIFRSRPVTEQLREELTQREKAIVAFERGMEYFTQKQTKRAVGQFKKAVKAIPSMGAAYVFEGITWIQVEEFEKAAQAADKVVENSTDDRAKAGAHGLHAVIALYSGDVMSAELLFRKAAELDPTDKEFSTSAEELSSGKYAPARVAKTAARMSCLKKKRFWSQKGLLARGNFPDDKTFTRAKNKAKRKAEYKSSYDMWVGWECR